MRRNCIFKILFFILALVPPAIAAVYMVVLPVIVVNDDVSSEEARLRERGGAREISAAGSETLAAYIATRTEEAYWKNRLAMAKTGSAGLVVDLVNRKVYLDIRGVPIRECTIQEMKVSEALLKKKGQLGIIDWISSPHVLVKEWTTIVKQPIKVKIAPKNETEAEAQAPEKFQEDRGDVQYSLKFSPEVTIHFEQVAPEMNSSDWKEKMKNDFRLKWEIAKESLQRLSRHELPEHDLSIAIRLAPDDARAIYRALPENARMALRL